MAHNADEMDESLEQLLRGLRKTLTKVLDFVNENSPDKEKKFVSNLSDINNIEFKLTDTDSNSLKIVLLQGKEDKNEYSIEIYPDADDPSKSVQFIKSSITSEDLDGNIDSECETCNERDTCEDYQGSGSDSKNTHNEVVEEKPKKRNKSSDEVLDAYELTEEYEALEDDLKKFIQESFEGLISMHLKLFQNPSLTDLKKDCFIEDLFPALDYLKAKLKITGKRSTLDKRLKYALVQQTKLITRGEGKNPDFVLPPDNINLEHFFDRKLFMILRVAWYSCLNALLDQVDVLREIDNPDPNLVELRRKPDDPKPNKFQEEIIKSILEEVFEQYDKYVATPLRKMKDFKFVVSKDLESTGFVEVLENLWRALVVASITPSRDIDLSKPAYKKVLQEFKRQVWGCFMLITGEISSLEARRETVPIVKKMIEYLGLNRKNTDQER